MKRRVADVVADLLVNYGISDVFCLVGGGAMFLNDAFGHHSKLHVTYNQHEQACSMAAEGYVRATGKMAAVCVTTGPGGTNAITGVLGAFQDNYPMIVISGQVRYPTTADSTGLPLRFMGEQEHNIVDTVKNLTKYAVMIREAKDIVYELEKAFYLAREGRRGPCWVDIPMDIQSADIETEQLRHFTPPSELSDWQREEFLHEIKKARRPVILAGSGIRSTGYVKKFRHLATKMGIPVLAATYNADIFVNSDPVYYGNFGIIGGRAGNFIMQNADLIIGIGCRMTYRQIGFNYDQFAPNAKKMIIDVDEWELQKPTMDIDIPISADLKVVIDDLLKVEKFSFGNKGKWLCYCDMLRKRFPLYLDKFSKSELVNPYYFVYCLKEVLSENSMVVLGNSTIAAHVLQLGIDYSEQRIINNMNCGSMGYDLPAAIGAATALNDTVSLITGDGSIMLNLQELMTVKHYDLPIKIFISSNGGYCGIVRSQSNMFQHYVGCTKDTGVEMPDFKKIADAFNIPYIKIEKHKELSQKLKQVYEIKGAVICEWLQDPEQVIEPRVMNRKAENGIVSSPIDDMSPFLDREEYAQMSYDVWSAKA